jgi:hypothetical protein
MVVTPSGTGAGRAELVEVLADGFAGRVSQAAAKLATAQRSAARRVGPAFPQERTTLLIDTP